MKKGRQPINPSERAKTLSIRMKPVKRKELELKAIKYGFVFDSGEPKLGKFVQHLIDACE